MILDGELKTKRVLPYISLYIKVNWWRAFEKKMNFNLIVNLASENSFIYTVPNSFFLPVLAEMEIHTKFSVTQHN